MAPASPQSPAVAGSSPLHTLRQVFGYPKFRPQQEEIIEHLIAGGDAFVLMPTGGGKSLCYQLPALHRPGVGIVVSPLISLMKDQVDALRANGVRAAYYNSSLETGEARRVLAALHAGELDLLYVAPERLMTSGFLARLRATSVAAHGAAETLARNGGDDGVQGSSGVPGAQNGGTIPVALFAIDEAHCVSQWGHDFRPEYIELGRLRGLFPDVPIFACTATADPETRQDVRVRLGLADAPMYVAGFDRPNIRYTVRDKHRPLEQLLAFLRLHPDESGIVYCLSRKRTEQVAEHLTDAGVNAAAYHAGLDAARRRRVQEAFQQDEVHVVVATVAFGMGIDKPDVRFVVHYDLPKNLESYYQETGRSGRDGLPAEALLLFGLGDVAITRALIEGGTQRRERVAPAPDQDDGWSAPIDESQAPASEWGAPVDEWQASADPSPTPANAAPAPAHSGPAPRDVERVRIELHKMNSMVGFAEALTCRRRVLLGYFGERLETDCGNCDVCLDPPERYDATEHAQMALSCVYRVGQRFGAAHVADVLRGAETDRILRLGHDRLSTYGVGADLSREAWLGLLRQLVHLGYLSQDVAAYSVLKLTPAARHLLRGQEELVLAKPRVRVAAASRRKKRERGARDGAAGGTGFLVGGAGPEPIDLSSADAGLFEALRTLRRRLADEARVPAYVVFSDATLREMAVSRPTDQDELLAVSGVGAAKLERYGATFLTTIAEHGPSRPTEQD